MEDVCINVLGGTDHASPTKPDVCHCCRTECRSPRRHAAGRRPVRPGWVTLLDGKTLDHWNKVGETNWRIEDGAAVADKRTSKTPAYLVSKQSYKDFSLYVEFWPSHDANSGIFVRCSDPAKVGDHTCYEINIFDERKDPSYGTGSITHYVEIDPMPKAGGKWNTYEITMKGRDLTVVLNGQKTATLRNNLFLQGPVALQHGAGVIKFRKVAVKPL